MQYDLKTSPRRLSEACEKWTDKEILEALAVYAKAAAVDSWYLKHMEALHDELRSRRVKN